MFDFVNNMYILGKLSKEKIFEMAESGKYRLTVEEAEKICGKKGE